jgi:SLBB domain
MRLIKTYVLLLAVILWLLPGCASSKHDPYGSVQYPAVQPSAPTPPPESKEPPPPFIYVGGRVNKPGKYAWTNGMTLKDAIDAAGGLDEFGGHKMEITHLDGSENRYFLKPGWELTNNPALKPGDRLYDPHDP